MPKDRKIEMSNFVYNTGEAGYLPFDPQFDNWVAEMF